MIMERIFTKNRIRDRERISTKNRIRERISTKNRIRGRGFPQKT